MNLLAGTLVLLASLGAIAGCWAWLFSDLRRFHREYDQEHVEPVGDDIDLAAALRCIGGPPRERESLTPKLDAWSREGRR